MKCVFYTYRISQFGPATFHVLNSHIGLVASILHNAGRLCRKGGKKEGRRERREGRKQGKKKKERKKEKKKNIRHESIKAIAMYFSKVKSTH